VILAAWSLALRELRRFYRQPSRVAGVLATPVVFWLITGSGLGGDFLAHLYPGTLAMILLFASIFSTISIIEDRREGFLQGVLVAPVPGAGIALGKVLGGAAVALTQGLLFLALAPLSGLRPGPGGYAAACGVMALLAFALTSVGVLLAWRFESVQGYHAVINLVLVPMWILSGAVFRIGQAAPWVEAVMAVNPMAYGVSALRHALAGTAPHPFGASLGVTAAFAAAAFGLAGAAARSPGRRGVV
jgi:ABC-2 type transport system permease protein